MSSTPMEIDDSASSAPVPSLNVTRTLGNGSGVPNTAKISDIITTFRPTRIFRRNDVKDGSPRPSVLSIDFDDRGELCMTSESDESIQIYKAKEGRHDKMLLSKKYGVKLAQFTHASGGIIYASTKQNDAIRYLATHDNSFIRYFEGHEDTVNCLAMHPGTDNFISGSQDGTVALWDLSNKQWTAKLLLNNPRLLAWDPSGNVFGVACPSSACVLLYDYRGYTRGPFKTISTVGSPLTDRLGQHVSSGWTKLEFSNDGKHILLGIKGAYHVLFDAFDGDVKALLHKPEGGTKRAAPGEGQYGPDAELLESSGECGFSPDGRYVLSGSKKNVLVWDTLARADHGEVQEPTFVLEEDRETAVLKYNPRYNMLATADRELMFWLPDPHA